MSAKTYRSKPTTIEAIQWTGSNGQEVADWVGKVVLAGETQFEVSDDIRGFVFDEPIGGPSSACLYVKANDGWLDIEPSEWLAKDENGFYPIKDPTFTRKYGEGKAGLEIVFDGHVYTPEDVDVLRGDLIAYRDRAIANFPEGIEMTLVLSHVIGVLAVIKEQM